MVGRVAAVGTLVAVLLLLAGLAACGGSAKARPEDALQDTVAKLGKGRVACDDNSACTVIVPTPLHSNYEGFLLSVPVFEHLANDPDLAGVKRVTLTLNDDRSGQIFSITCAATDLKGDPTPTSLHEQCHSIYL
ncbi:MAG TPA: hypothetical protein VFU10_03220 [Gaiellaceae bacterium]|nr:hypothetical protein [Gaiellaceae bacterium]